MGEKLSEGIPYRDGEDSHALSPRCRLDVYRPEDPEARCPVVVWFYGGGLTSGERHIPAELKGQGMVVVAPDYRLSPSVRAPAYIEDAAAAVAWAFKNIHAYGGDPERIIVAGASAGAYLANMITLDHRWLARHNVEAGRIAGLVSMTGQMITHFTVRAEAVPEASKTVSINCMMWRFMSVFPYAALAYDSFTGKTGFGRAVRKARRPKNAQSWWPRRLSSRTRSCSMHDKG